MMDRASGILLPISALPSPYGIGTLGREAYQFAEFLHAAGQTYWQLLPLGPTGYGDSPYQSFSTFAGNPYYIDLDILIQDGLLEQSEVEMADWGNTPRYVDYGKIYTARFAILRKAFQRDWPSAKNAVDQFTKKHPWLSDYSLFMAIKSHYDMKCWLDWPDEEIRFRTPEAVERYSRELAGDVDFFRWTQYEFYRQWEALRDYIHSLGIQMIGDLPIYVAMDSADVWAEPEFFQLGENRVPTQVAGVPPDFLCADGQLWGNPLYHYDRMRQDGFDWWIRRFEGAGQLYDVIRIDHFRGLESYWAVPYGDTTAKNGTWCKGPGMELVGLLTSRFPNLDIIAEDLGFPSPEVQQLLTDSGLPGMKLLEYAFGVEEPENCPPHAYCKNCVCYVGTHDNETIVQWRDHADPTTLSTAKKYFGITEAEGFNWGMIRGGMTSVANTFVVQMQDCLGLGAEARMNTPGTSSQNWRWRLLPEEASPILAEKLFQYTKLGGRTRIS